jgi:16S rRNA (cytosine1402-N4)-methyltransferase
VGNSYHKTVMPERAVELLAVKKGGIYIDATIGGGGHGQKILEEVGSAGLLIGLDRDQAAIEHCRGLFQGRKNVTLERTNFRSFPEVLAEKGIEKIDGILFDLGVSDQQFGDPARGFSFRNDGPLDMRMDPTAGQSARDLVNSLDQKQLAQIITEYGEERWAKRIAAGIVARRLEKEITTTGELAGIVEQNIPRKYWPERIHPATRTFQAVRIAVNNELAILKETFSAAIEHLRSGGRIVVISFHSLEDRIVKTTFNEYARGCICPPKLPQCVCQHKALVKIITRKPVMAEEQELAANPQSRSAKTRAAERLAADA